MEYFPRTQYCSQFEWEHFSDRIIFMSMYKGTKDGNLKVCISISSDVKAHANIFCERTLVILRTRDRINIVWSAHLQARRFVDHSADMIMLHLRESGHPIFRASLALDRGSLKSKKGGKLWVHYNDDSSTGELLFRTIISVNQLSVYGVISDLGLV